MENINYEDLLYIKYKKNIVVYMFLILLVLLSFISYKVMAYNNLESSGIYKEGFVEVTLTVDSIETIKNGDFLKIDNIKYYYEIINFGEISSYENIYFQSVYIKIEKEFYENEIVEFNIFYDKERIIKKVINLIF